MNQPGLVPLTHYCEVPASLMQQRAAGFLAEIERRRWGAPVLGPAAAARGD